ncbi:MAG: HhH-GPD-type base excision DNA repair protein [Chloroflexota bacterium]
MPAPKPAERLFFTDDDAANRLIATDPMALLIGFALDQQVPVQKAFSGPQVLLQRLGTLDPAALAKVDEAALLAAAKGPPAIHRFPAAMAKRVRELATYVAREYDGNASRVWTDATDARDLKQRLGALPGFGEMKVASLLAVLARRLDVRPAGIEEVLPAHPTLGDVDSPTALASYQATKRAAKAAARASSER